MHLHLEVRTSDTSFYPQVLCWLRILKHGDGLAIFDTSDLGRKSMKFGKQVSPKHGFITISDIVQESAGNIAFKCLNLKSVLGFLLYSMVD